MNEIGVAVLGTGFMGLAHAYAYRAVGAVFPELPRPRMMAVADVSLEGAQRFADRMGFEVATSDWRAAVANPAVQVVSVATPNLLHKEMALAAIGAGKHVLCEKPLAPSGPDALDMVRAAESARVRTQVGYNYIHNPLLMLAREMIETGELGEITGFRGIHAEDYMADPEVPWSFRVDPAGGGVLHDLGSHILGMARFLVGPIVELNADLETIVGSRPVAPGSRERRAITVDDSARLLVRFERGCGGSIEATWTATGRKMQLGFEVVGRKGSLAFTQERLNELNFHRAGADPRTSGFTRIEAGPQHPPYGQLCVAGGHQLGFNDLKTLEVAQFLRGIATGCSNAVDFREGYEIQRLVDAAIQSSRSRSWIRLA